jgi:hypothetical protein
LFKNKLNAEGKVDNYKAQLVAKGYSQAEGIDFGEIFSLVSKLNYIRFILFVVVAFNFEVKKMDVKETFIHADLEEIIYMKQPEGFVVKGKKEMVHKLKNSLYGLMQSPRMWYQKFDTYIIGLRFVRIQVDHYAYSKQVGNHFIYVVLDVNDMLLVENNMDVIKEVKSQLSSKFDMKDIGDAKFIMGKDIKRDHANMKL